MENNVKGSVYEGSFSLIIRGEHLELEVLDEILGIKATRKVRRGECAGGLLSAPAEQDQWIHTVNVNEPNGSDPAMNGLLEHLLAHRAQLDRTAERASVILRLSVQSDYARISFLLMPETMQKIISLGHSLEISSVSWGEVI